jgi:hypothetical protein
MSEQVLLVNQTWGMEQFLWIFAHLVAEGWVLLFKAIDVFREASLHHSFSAWHYKSQDGQSNRDTESQATSI